MSIRVLIPQPIEKEGEEYLRVRGYEIVNGHGFEEADMLDDIVDCNAIIVRTAKINSKILSVAPKLKLIVRHGAGYDGVDIEAARQKGVLVAVAGNANSNSVAELTLFYMLYCSRNFKAVELHYLEDYYYSKMGLPKTELKGKTLGLIGLGNIGAQVAQKAAIGFGMKIIGYDPYHHGQLPEYIVRTKDRKQVFQESDYVSLHIPATRDTIHSIGAQEFAWMKQTAYLINTARGNIIDEEALVHALKQKQIAGAALDVLNQEPFDQNNPLHYMENVVTAPHIGAATKEACVRASMACAKAVDDFFRGFAPEFVIPEMRDMVTYLSRNK